MQCEEVDGYKGMGAGPGLFTCLRPSTTVPYGCTKLFLTACEQQCKCAVASALLLSLVLYFLSLFPHLLRNQVTLFSFFGKRYVWICLKRKWLAVLQQVVMFQLLIIYELNVLWAWSLFVCFPIMKPSVLKQCSFLQASFYTPGFREKLKYVTSVNPIIDSKPRR